MDPILQVLLSWQFMLFGLAVAMVVYVIRTVAEYITESTSFKLSKSKFWNDLFLPIIPIVLGVVTAAFLVKFPYPGFTPNAQGVVARGDRIIFGLVSGGFSTIMYRVVKAILWGKIQAVAQAIAGGGTTPAAPVVTVTTAPVTVNQQLGGDVAPSELPGRGQV